MIATRLASQGLSPALPTPDQVAARLLALQGQDDQAVLWAVGVRCGCSESEVVDAIATGRLLRTWPMRGTLHLVRSEDARWMLRLLSPRVLAGSAKRRRDLEIDAAVLSAAETVLVNALAEGPRPREELMGALEAAGISVKAQRGYHLLWYLAQQEVLCCGPKQAKSATFVLMDSWAPSCPHLDREEALARLALAYFTGHGPATVHDLAWWAGLTLKDARAGIDGVREQLRWEEFEGRVYYRVGGSEGAAGGLLLLPGFDEYLLGYQDRSLTLSAENAGLVVPGSNGIFKPMIVSDGRVVGTWRRVVKRDLVEVTFEPFAGMELDPKELRAAAADYARFLGKTLA